MFSECLALIGKHSDRWRSVVVDVYGVQDHAHLQKLIPSPQLQSLSSATLYEIDLVDTGAVRRALELLQACPRLESLALVDPARSQEGQEVFATVETPFEFAQLKELDISRCSVPLVYKICNHILAPKLAKITVQSLQEVRETPSPAHIFKFLSPTRFPRLMTMRGEDLALCNVLELVQMTHQDDHNARVPPLRLEIDRITAIEGCWNYKGEWEELLRLAKKGQLVFCPDKWPEEKEEDGESSISRI